MGVILTALLLGVPPDVPAPPDVPPAPKPRGDCACPDNCRCPGGKAGPCECGAQRKWTSCPDNDGGPCTCGCRKKEATACKCGEPSGRIDVPRIIGRLRSYPGFRTPSPAPVQSHWPRQAPTRRPASPAGKADCPT